MKGRSVPRPWSPSLECLPSAFGRAEGGCRLRYVAPRTGPRLLLNPPVATIFPAGREGIGRVPLAAAAGALLRYVPVLSRGLPPGRETE